MVLMVECFDADIVIDVSITDDYSLKSQKWHIH